MNTNGHKAGTVNRYDALMTERNSNTPYYDLGPDEVIQAVESLDLLCDGRLLALNSFENRVYQVGQETGPPLIAKFYRPGRWSDDQILEEHEFALQLAAEEIPLVPPMVIAGNSLHHFDGFRFALFERRGGHAPELGDRETRLWLGRFMGRIHAVGASQDFKYRPALTPERFGRESIQSIEEGQWLPPHLETAFQSLSSDLMVAIDAAWERAGNFQPIRLHGDCHVGNVLWRDGPFFVDLDDSMSGPAVQDLWMFLSGESAEMSLQLKDLLEGYKEFCAFDHRQLQLIEALRTQRMLHHAAWLGRRWEDPAFPLAFPWFGEGRYWEDMILSLREQQARLQEPAIELPWD